MSKSKITIAVLAIALLNQTGCVSIPRNEVCLNTMTLLRGIESDFGIPSGVQSCRVEIENREAVVQFVSTDDEVPFNSRTIITYAVQTVSDQFSAEIDRYEVYPAGISDDAPSLTVESEEFAECFVHYNGMLKQKAEIGIE